MANVKQSVARRMSMAERAEQQMELHFPDVPEVLVWHRKTNDGFTTIPRTLPIAMQVIDGQTKGQPAGHTLFCLWARMPDHSLVSIENPATFAGEAGFSGARAVDTWRRRMKELQRLGFLKAKSGTSGDFHYVLLLNPNIAIQKMRDGKLVQDQVYVRFLERLADIGAMSELAALKAYEDEQLKTSKAQERALKKAASGDSSDAKSRKKPSSKDS